MELADIAALERWRELEQEIHKRTGMNAAVFNTDGIRITDFQNWANRLCPVIKNSEKGRNFNCAVAHQNLAVQASKSGKAVIEECDAGLIKFVVPIFLNGEFLGVAGGCGCLNTSQEIDPFMIQKTIGLTNEKLQDLAADIPRTTRQQTELHAKFVRNEIGRIIEAYQKRKIP